MLGKDSEYLLSKNYSEKQADILSVVLLLSVRD
jgi:hypothetical protein